MKKKRKLFVALVTVCALVMGSFAVPSAAVNVASESAGTVTESVSPAEGTAAPESEAPTILREDISLRGEYEKHFLMSDGTYQAAVYNEPVHKLEGDEWIEIDNTLSLQSGRYATADGLMDVSFANSFGDGLVTMTQGEYTLSWGVQAVSDSLTATATSQAQLVTADQSNLDAEQRKTLAEKSSSMIRYPNALRQDVDLEYVVLPTRVKENIILQSKQDISGYIVTVYAENLSARLLENRQIEFYDGEDVIFTMASPYMYDAAGELSENISVEMVSKGGVYFIAMTPDADWLDDENRVYPVTIDPEVKTSRAWQNIVDNYVHEGYGNQNGSLDRLYVGNKSGATARSYIKFNVMPTLALGASIVSAALHLTITAGTSTVNAAEAYQVTGGNWTEGEITWDNQPVTSSEAAGITLAATTSAYTIFCDSAVRHWYTGNRIGTNENYGIMLRYTDESIDDYNAVYSSDCATVNNRPVLSISYASILSYTPEIVWPAPDYCDITSPWGYRTYDNKVHRGIDIGCNEATLVAAISGTVGTFYNSSAGYAMVIYKPDSDFQVRYYHLKENGYLVEPGSTVAAGDEIAISGNTGTSSGPHLHFQLQWGDDKYKSYNPLEYYHRNDQRSSWENPNPMFLLVNGVFVPNEDFDYAYTASDYNSTDVSWAD